MNYSCQEEYDEAMAGQAEAEAEAQEYAEQAEAEQQTPMNSLNRDQWTAVDERFDKEFTCVVTYEKWPDEEEQRLREPQYKFKDFPNTNPKIIKNFLHSELEKVRQETIESFVDKYYGKRCKDYEEGCPCCDMWKLADDYLTNLKSK